MTTNPHQTRRSLRLKDYDYARAGAYFIVIRRGGPRVRPPRHLRGTMRTAPTVRGEAGEHKVRPYAIRGFVWQLTPTLVTCFEQIEGFVVA